LRRPLPRKARGNVHHRFGPAGNPGSTEMPLMDALVDAPDITYVLGLQEATAVGMADLCADVVAIASVRTGTHDISLRRAVENCRRALTGEAPLHVIRLDQRLI
jgi:hypothetical protein